MPQVIAAGPGAIAREISIDAPPEIVFSYFTDPAKHGLLWHCTEVELDARPGGKYLEVEPPTRVVYTWGWAEEGSSVLPAGGSTVELILEPTGAATRLRL